MSNVIVKQESPPAGNHKRSTVRGITCPSTTCPGGGGGRYPFPPWGVPHPCPWGGVHHPARGYHPWLGVGGCPIPGQGGTLSWGTPHPDLVPVTGVPPPRKDIGPVKVLWDGDKLPPRKDMGPVEVLWDGDGVPPWV